MPKQKKPQKIKVLEYMMAHGSITPKEAIFGMGITRLADCIYQLKEMGYGVESHLIPVPDHDGYTTYVSRYSLKKEN